MIHLYCGEGKGKTTAGIGLCIRSAGYGHKILCVRFLKNNHSGELSILNRIKEVTVLPCEKEFGFYNRMTEEQKKEAKEYYSRLFGKAVKAVETEKYQVLFLDEIIASYNYALIDKEELLSFLKNKPEDLEVVMTGRNPAEELVELADYVSEIQKVKHPYDRGVKARKGIEY